MDLELQEFTRRLIHFQHEHPVFRRHRWFQGQPIYGPKQEDIAWFNPRGEQANEELWSNGEALSLGVFINVMRKFPQPEYPWGTGNGRHLLPDLQCPLRSD